MILPLTIPVTLPVTLALALHGCAPSTRQEPPDSPATRRPDVVLVTLDTTRADRLGAYGYDGAGTDWIDAKAKVGTRFDRAYAVQPLTIPSHSSIMTGLWPWHHGVRSNGDATLGEQHQTLAEHFRAGGWQTGGSVAAFVTSRAWGFAQGFDTYVDQLDDRHPDTWHQQRPADRVIDDAIEIIDQADATRPLMLWVHLYDAHFPYDPPEAYDQAFGERPYDGELAFMDDQLERLEQALAARGRAPIWVLVGDHGESLGQHRELTHGLFVYDATQHVPLVISGPGVPARVVTQPVSQVDLLPTLLALAGLPLPEGLDGRVQPGSPHPAWMESFQLTEQFGYAPHTAVVEGSHKLIATPTPELYELRRDPGEQDDLAATEPSDLARLQAIYAGLEPQLPTGRTQALDPDALARLQALGYVATSSFEVDFASLPDPADHREVIGKVLRAEMQSLQGQHESAVATMMEALAEEPDVAGLYTRSVRVLLAAGQPERAHSLLEDAVQRFPDDVDLLLRAASTVGRGGDNERSLALARAALQADPGSERAAEFIVGALINLERPREAVAAAQAWQADHPQTASIAALEGILRFEAGDLRRAESLLRQAAASPRPRQGVCQRLAAMALAAGVLEDADELIGREIELYGPTPVSQRLLLKLRGRQGDDGEALALADALLEREPEDTELLLARAVALFDLGRAPEAQAAVEQALVRHPEHPDMLMLLANILKQRGQQEEALAVRAQAQAAHDKRVEAAQAAPAQRTWASPE